MACKVCKGPTQGYKCDMCGEESPMHKDDHECGSAHCMPKCGGCNQAETQCSCQKK